MNAINWFEVPAVDFERAVQFYEAIIGVLFHRELVNGKMNGIFPGDEQGVGGAVVSGEGYTPNPGGSIVYLNANGQLDAILSRVEAAGGQIVRPRTEVNPFGHIAWLIDTEGNRIGLLQEPTE